MDKGGADRDDAETERNGRDEPAGPDPLAHDVGGNLEQNVRDVEDGEQGIVVVTRHAKVFLKASNFGISCETKKVSDPVTLLSSPGGGGGSYQYLLCQ